MRFFAIFKDYPNKILVETFKKIFFFFYISNK